MVGNNGVGNSQDQMTSWVAPTACHLVVAAGSAECWGNPRLGFGSMGRVPQLISEFYPRQRLSVLTLLCLHFNLQKETNFLRGGGKDRKTEMVRQSSLSSVFS